MLKQLAKIFRIAMDSSPGSLLIIIISSAAGFLYPAVSTRILSSIFHEFSNTALLNLHKIYFFMVLFIAIYILKTILQSIAGLFVSIGIYEKLGYKLNIYIGEKCTKLPFISMETPEILNKLNRAKDCVTRAVIPQLIMITISVFSSFISVLLVITLLASYSLWFLPISLLSVLPYLVARIIRGKEFYYLKWFQAPKRRSLDYFWSLFNNKQAVKEMRVNGSGDYLAEKWTYYRDAVLSQEWNFRRKDSLTLLVCDFLRTLGYLTSIFFAYRLVIHHEITIGLFGACIAAFAIVQEQTRSFLVEFGRFKEHLLFSKDYLDFLELDDDVEGRVQIKEDFNQITMDNVSFRYPNSTDYALKNVSLQLHKGEKLAIVGKNGSGKTTLAKLIMGMYSSSSGSIYYNGTDLKDINKTSYYSLISSIWQDFVTYKLTIRENIAISKTQKMDSDDAILNVVKMMGVENIVRENGLDTPIGSEFGGIELSGGDNQRLGLARTMFRDSSMVVLDEPTSAMDPTFESEVLEKFLGISENKTSLVISHRLGLCRVVDRIIVMNNGEIVGIGTHKELLENNAEYIKLYTAQEQWYH